MIRGRTQPEIEGCDTGDCGESVEERDPPETKETLGRLVREGFSDADARVLLGQAVAVEICCVLKEQKPFNRERFVRNLRNLPTQPQE